ncbi:hypothetical protein M2192_007308 [Bradyrhizobium elkanii USDA 61]|jgi:hypothetical protein|uniref:Uncharacterized protein n=1 Tax=Bradyrhizobium elkanii TaxID=29448 RepID=A0A8I1Y4Z1_BRAEL|nr:hypothetical protein [Bradyrhizobium elkanii]MCS4010348.1 hypothetical protein [Bradyrhizobium elkanii USDA 61]MCP1926180.1 hypothetical protein [Bradyrhizobium elkanii]MCS3476327.1 hypothetical protein [Bradyrhizobium elkanii]MCS3583062.1 hypothetical protein [Bradyrhizobium elkanii]
MVEDVELGSVVNLVSSYQPTSVLATINNRDCFPEPKVLGAPTARNHLKLLFRAIV